MYFSTNSFCFKLQQIHNFYNLTFVSLLIIINLNFLRKAYINYQRVMS